MRSSKTSPVQLARTVMARAAVLAVAVPMTVATGLMIADAIRKRRVTDPSRFPARRLRKGGSARRRPRSSPTATTSTARCLPPSAGQGVASCSRRTSGRVTSSVRSSRTP
ncbi:hypothetical protein NKG05_28110 [Oerskovia sp. M15]